MSKHYGSVFNNEQDLIYALLELHNNGDDIDLDPMFNKGMFYKNKINIPKLRYDINAETNGYNAVNGDATKLPIKDNSVNCMILDPPFMFGTHGQTKNNVMTKRYTMFDNFEQLEKTYKNIIAEGYRVLAPKGKLIFKCQDYTDNKTTLTHINVYQWAIEQGFVIKDLAILVKENKIYNGNLKQKHLRKTHTYFYVFEKK